MGPSVRWSTGIMSPPARSAAAALSPVVTRRSSTIRQARYGAVATTDRSDAARSAAAQRSSSERRSARQTSSAIAAATSTPRTSMSVPQRPGEAGRPYTRRVYGALVDELLEGAERRLLRAARGQQARLPAVRDARL